MEIALIVLGLLALLVFNPGFRRFAIVCGVAAIAAVGLLYMEVHREWVQACSPTAVAVRQKAMEDWRQRYRGFPGLEEDIEKENTARQCEEWLAERK